jgi:hypothetical protein
MTMVCAIVLTVASAGYEARFDDALARATRHDYTAALAGFRSLLEAGVRDPNLFYNLGNCYYRLDDVPRAVASYTRAVQLDPGLEDARYNLSHAVARTPGQRPLPEVEGWRAGFFWVDRLPPGAALAGAVLCWWCFWALLALWMLRRVRRAWLGAATLLAASVVLAAGAWVRVHPPEVIVAAAPGIPVRYATSPDAPERFVLQPGDRALVEARRGDWVRVRVAESGRGWVEERHVLAVGPPYRPLPEPDPGRAPAPPEP